MRRALDTSDGELALSLSASLKGFLIEQWRPLEARDLLTCALRVATEQTPAKLRADALLARSHVRVRDGGDREDAETALGLYREIGDARGVARSLVALGFHELGAGRLVAAGRRADEARHCLRVAGLDERLPGLMSLRMLAAPTFEEANRRGQDTIRALRELGAVRHIGIVYADLAVFALEDDRPREALSLAEQALVIEQQERDLAASRAMNRHFEQERDSWGEAYKQRAAKTDKRIGELEGALAQVAARGDILDYYKPEWAASLRKLLPSTGAPCTDATTTE